MQVAIQHASPAVATAVAGWLIMPAHEQANGHAADAGALGCLRAAPNSPRMQLHRDALT
jgi:hypothetical protein